MGKQCGFTGGYLGDSLNLEVLPNVSGPYFTPHTQRLDTSWVRVVVSNIFCKNITPSWGKMWLRLTHIFFKVARTPQKTTTLLSDYPSIFELLIPGNMFFFLSQGKNRLDIIFTDATFAGLQVWAAESWQLPQVNTMDIPSNTCRRWAPTNVINGVMGPYKWPKTNGVTGVILPLLMGTPFITGDGAHLVYLFDNMSSIQRIWPYSITGVPGSFLDCRYLFKERLAFGMFLGFFKKRTKLRRTDSEDSTWCMLKIRRAP